MSPPRPQIQYQATNSFRGKENTKNATRNPTPAHFPIATSVLGARMTGSDMKTASTFSWRFGGAPSRFFLPLLLVRRVMNAARFVIAGRA